MADRFEGDGSRLRISRSAKGMHYRKDGMLYLLKALIDKHPELRAMEFVHLIYCEDRGEIALRLVDQWDDGVLTVHSVAKTVQINSHGYLAAKNVPLGYYSLRSYIPGKLLVFGVNPQPSSMRYEVVAYDPRRYSEADFQAFLSLLE